MSVVLSTGSTDVLPTEHATHDELALAELADATTWQSWQLLMCPPCRPHIPPRVTPLRVRRRRYIEQPVEGGWQLTLDHHTHTSPTTGEP